MILSLRLKDCQLFLKKFGKFESNDEKINNIIKSTSFELLKRRRRK